MLMPLVIPFSRPDFPPPDSAVLLVPPAQFPTPIHVADPD